MQYKFFAYGHPNILAAHKTTLEFTKDGELSLKGDCIIAVKADFELSKIKKFIKSSKSKNIAITIQAISKSRKIKEKIIAEINPDFSSDREFVIRKTDFISERTAAIKADKSAFELKRDFIECLRKKDNKITIIIKKQQPF